MVTDVIDHLLLHCERMPWRGVRHSEAALYLFPSQDTKMFLDTPVEVGRVCYFAPATETIAKQSKFSTASTLMHCRMFTSRM
jgi:hypothetical protein